MQKIILSGKYGSIIDNYALVDDEDFERINKHKWYAHKQNKSGKIYAQRGIYIGGGRDNAIQITGHMSRLILNCPADKFVDHINGNTLDNQKNNIRISTRSQNNCNRIGWGKTSKYKGVFFDKESGKFRCVLKINNTTIQLGRFINEEDAALAYNNEAIKQHGEFAVLNIIL